MAAPAGRAAINTELSHRNDSVIGIFFPGNKNKDDA